MDKLNKDIIKSMKDASKYLMKGIVLPSEINVCDFEALIRPNNDDKEYYTNTDICSQCKGVCCASCGCSLSPDDLITVDYDTIKKLIDTGFVSIDWWESYERDNCFIGDGYYLRMRNINADIIDPLFGNGVCKMLTVNGCALDFGHRPKGGRTLSPKYCINRHDEEAKFKLYDKFTSVEDWHKYHDILMELRYEL